MGYFCTDQVAQFYLNTVSPTHTPISLCLCVVFTYWLSPLYYTFVSVSTRTLFLMAQQVLICMAKHKIQFWLGRIEFKNSLPFTSRFMVAQSMVFTITLSVLYDIFNSIFTRDTFNALFVYSCVYSPSFIPVQYFWLGCTQALNKVFNCVLPCLLRAGV